jgi:cytochrome c oxidase subunit 2
MMHIDRLEATFMRISLLMLFVFATAITIAVFGLGVQLPGVVEQIAPAEVDSAPGFSEPGVRQVYPGKYEAHIVVQTWQFTPAEITVPVGSEVTFYLASKDVIHGFKILDTNVNVMVIPGQISEVTHTFDEPGEFAFYCHEYCGALHHTMSGSVNVVDVEQQ